MKAAVYYDTGSPDVFRYEHVADPVCRPGQVLVDVEAISIEGGDTFTRLGGPVTSTPHIVGYQCAGTIREVGAGVINRESGQASWRSRPRALTPSEWPSALSPPG